ncbi:ATP-grasp domain-containing protein [Streptomyces sp. SID8374]|uniref:ATP-grasp domain-containing protein n=1 Tax=Streptomyces sp. SID8374 TaxID=2690354 RepID=UPI001367B03D|nr:ATP-grasp domain-containing protein [Streptomyces sp. SID8374]MYX15473.1 ATP-grasp domain-containing protein [Streptomyces sp. SID8374]
MPNAKPPAFVLLELLNHMVLVAREAKRRGFHVIALNQGPLLTEGPFAVPEGVVDEVVAVTTWTDTAEVGRLLDDVLDRYEVAGTYTAFEGALRPEAVLRERSGLPTSTAATVTRVLDKALVRGALHAEGLTELRSTTLDKALTWDSWGFDGPAVLKPANGTGSALCHTVASLDELRSAAEETASVTVTNPLMSEYIQAHGAFVLEERAEGELVSVESLVHEGEVHIVGITGRYVSALDPVVELGVCFPYAHPRHTEIVDRVTAFHRALGLTHGPTHVEVMVPEEGPVELIDFNPRTAGVGAVVCIGNAYGTDYAVPLTDLACGIRPDLAFLDRTPRNSADLLLLPPPGAAVMTDLSFPDGTEYGRATKPFGQPLSGRADQLDVVAMVVVTADSPEELHRRTREVRRTTVFNGEPLGDNPNNRVIAPRHRGTRTSTQGDNRA